MAVIERLGIGGQAAQMRRLDHARDFHGLQPFDCPACGGRGCDGCLGIGQLFRAGDMNPCGPACPLHEVKPV